MRHAANASSTSRVALTISATPVDPRLSIDARYPHPAWSTPTNGADRVTASREPLSIDVVEERELLAAPSP
jgi:hypothetical protein